LRKSVGIALIDQAVLSLFNLALNLVLIRLAAPAEFGRFIFAAAVVLVLTSLQNALVSTPLSIMLPGRAAPEQASVEKTILSFDLLFRLAAALAAPLACLMINYDAIFLLAIGCATFATLGRESARSLALAREQAEACLRIDITAVLTSIGAIALLWWVFSPAVASLAGIAIGNVVAVLPHRAKFRYGRLDPLAVIATYREKCWPDTRWSLIGAGTTEVQYRSYVFAIELFREATTLAAVQAGRLLLGPLPLVVAAWGRVARPAMARHLSLGNPGKLMQITVQGMASVLVVGVLYCAALYLAWPLAEAWIFRGKYQDVGQMTIAWGAYMLVVIAHMVLSVPLQAAMLLKDLARVTIATAILTCLLLVGLASPVPAIYTVVALTIAEIVALIWIFVLVLRLAHSHGEPLPQPMAGLP
jgi:hypothetical protein